MYDPSMRVPSGKVREAAVEALRRRGVHLEDVAKIVYQMQMPYNRGLTMEHCVESVQSVLRKREMQHAILVGVELDELAEKGLLSEPLLSIVQSDEGLFGIDETIAIGAAFTYGSIAISTFGHLDKNKIGIINELDTVKGHRVHTFLDDLVASLAACAASRVAHRSRDLAEEDESFLDIPPEQTAPEANVKGART